MIYYLLYKTPKYCPVAIRTGPLHIASTPGQNVHLVLPHNHVLVSSSYLANSSSQLVVLSSYLIESSRHLVSSFMIYCLVVPLLVYSSTRRITFELVMSPFNSSCNDLGKRGDLRDLGTTTEQSNMAAIEPSHKRGW